MRNMRVVTSQVGWHHLVSTDVLRLSWRKPQLHRPIPLCSQALSRLSPKLLWFSQSYTPALHCWHLSHPKTTLYPGCPESQPGKIRKQWDSLSCHPLGSLQALVHAARGWNLITHLWEGTHPPALRAHGRQELQMLESAEGHTRESPDPPPAHPAPPPCTASSHMWERESLKAHTNLSHNSHSPEAFPLRHKSNASAEYTLWLNYSHQANIGSHTVTGSTQNPHLVTDHFLFNIVAVVPCYWLQN